MGVKEGHSLGFRLEYGGNRIAATLADDHNRLALAVLIAD
jgi:hypothetical protein